MKNHIHRAKFSLIELLVVIAIIAVLASMLLPALNNARASAKKTNCVNQIKQLSSACFLYAGDNYDYFPHDGNPNEWKYVLGSSYYYKCYSHGGEENPHHNKQWHCTDYNEEVAQTNNAGDCSVPTLQITANVAGSSKIWGTNNTKEAVGVKLTFFRPSLAGSLFASCAITLVIAKITHPNTSKIFFFIIIYYLILNNIITHLSPVK